MAQCKLPPHDFIKSAFTPIVGVTCSTLAENICRKNNLCFTELVQPFCKLNSDVSYKDPYGAVITIHNLKVTMLNLNYHPPQPTTARKYLNMSVTQTTEPRSQIVMVGDYTLDIPVTTPWFEAWRDTFLNVQYPSDHEFTKHFLATIFVISSDDPNPVETLQQLNQSSSQSQPNTANKLPKWFFSNFLRYYVLIHDNTEGTLANATQVYEAMKLSYGAHNCYLLHINSRPITNTNEQLPDPWSQFVSTSMGNIQQETVISDQSNSGEGLINHLELEQESNEIKTVTYHPLSPDGSENSTNDLALERELLEISQINNTPHGIHLSTEDVEQIKLFVHEFCSRALLPYVEKQINQLNDSVSNKKAVSKSLFSATKRWFTPNKPGSGNVTINNLIYAYDSSELQIRKLGDLCFMFGHYTMAFQAYHTAKRDFHADQAWLYYSGALEMAALAAFMSNETTRKTCDYMEESITTYMNSCKLIQFATRATLLSLECLKGRSLYGESAHQLIRMTSEDSDLRSALLLEQAAYCFLNCSRPHMVRKYAFHMVLAGHRFSKAAHKKHALRCYKQAFQVYNIKGWSLAEDHMHFTIGKLASSLNYIDEACQSLSMLLTNQSKQTPQQQALFVKDYLLTLGVSLQNQQHSSAFILPLPVIQWELIKILVGPTPPLTIPGKVSALGTSFRQKDNVSIEKWCKLEEILVQEAQGSLPLLFKPLVVLYSGVHITNVNIFAIIGEPIQISITLCNPLQILLTLKNIYLSSNFKCGGKLVTNECDNLDVNQYIKTHSLKSILLQPNSTQDVVLTVTPLAEGELSLTGVFYELALGSGAEEISISGRQLINIKESKMNKSSKTNLESLQKEGITLDIMPSAPCLQVTFCEIQTEVLCNEIQKVSIEFRNMGNVPLHKIYMATSLPHLISCFDFQSSRSNLVGKDISEAPSVKEREARKSHVARVVLPSGQLDPGQSHSITIWLQAPDVKGPVTIDMLFYYENIDSSAVPRYRLVKHIWQLVVQDSIKTELFAQHSFNSKSVGQLAISLEATNLNKTHEMMIEVVFLRASLESPKWTLLKQAIVPQNVYLQMQQCAYILLKARRSTGESSTCSEVPFHSGSESAQNTNLPYLDFPKRKKKFIANIFEENYGEQKAEHEGILTLQWRAHVTDNFGSKRIVYGQNYALINKLNKEEMEEEQEKPIILYDPNESVELNLAKGSSSFGNNTTQKQITYSLVHSSHVNHNFDGTKLCIIPIKLLLHNVTDIKLVVIVKTLGTSSSSPPPSFRPTLFYPHPSKHFRWIGVSGTVKTVAAFSSEVVLLKAVVLGPGTYDLGARLEIHCHEPDNPKMIVLQTCRTQSALVVTNINN